MVVVAVMFGRTLSFGKSSTKAEAHALSPTMGSGYDSPCTSPRPSCTSPRVALGTPTGRKLERRASVEAQLLATESMCSIADVELLSHGTLDLHEDVPELLEDPVFTCERFLQGE